MDVTLAVGDTAEPFGTVLFRWKPEELDEMKRIEEDIADEYLIIGREEAHSGIVIYAKYRGQWRANPYSLRPLVRQLLRQARFEQLRYMADHPVMVVKTENTLSGMELAELRQALAKSLWQPAQISSVEEEVIPPPLVIALGLDDSIESLSEADMNRHGWYRKPAEKEVCRCADGACSHLSDCSVHNAPAEPNGPCDCAGDQSD